MRAAFGALIFLTACGSGSPVPTNPQTPSVAITAFSSPTDPSDLQLLRETFPSAQVEILDHLYHPDRAQELGIPSNGYAQIRRLDSSGEPIGQGERVDLEWSLEELAVLSETLALPPTTVHLHFPQKDSQNPKDQFSLLDRELRSRGFQLVELDQSPSLVIWMAGSKDLSEEELAQLRTLEGSGAHVLFGVEPTSDPKLQPHLSQLLASLGVSLESGVLASDYQQVWETLGTPSSQDRYNHAASRFLAHPATGSLGESARSELSVIASHAAIIAPRHGGSTQAHPLLLSHREAWTERTHDGRVGDGERQGSLPLALASTDSSPSAGRVVVLADTTMLSNRWSLHPGNRLFFGELLEWLLPTVVADRQELQAKPETVTATAVFPSGTSLRSARLTQSVRSVELQNQSDSRGSYVWTVVKGKRDEREFVGNDLATSALNDLQALGSIRTWTEPANDRLEALGLLEPTGELLLVDSSGRSQSLLLGGTPHNAQGRYALQPESKTVHLLVSPGLAALLGPEAALEETRFLPQLEWHRFEIPGERTLRIERRDTQWFVAGRRGVENQGVARELARELLALTMADADAQAPSNPAAFQASFIDTERRPTRIAIHRSDDGWLAYSDYSRRWGRVSPRIAERIVELANSLP